MSDELYEIGAAKMAEVYAGDVVGLPKGAMAFNDVMMESLFAQVWTRDVLSMRDRRLLLIGAIAANGGGDILAIQAKATLKNGELTPDELRETLIMLAPYAGYPNVAPLIMVVETAIAEYNNEQAAGSEES